MPPRKRLAVAGADPPPQKPRRIEPAAPRRLWTGSSTVHDVLYAQQVNGLTLQSTVRDLFDAWNIGNSATFTEQYGHVTIGDTTTVVPFADVSGLQNELEGFSAYDKLRDFAIGAALLRTYGVDTLSQWSAWRGFREDITLFTRDALDTAAREAGLKPTRLGSIVDARHLMAKSHGKGIVQIKVAMPLVESVYLHIRPHIREELYFKGFASDATEGNDPPKPDLMLAPLDVFGNQLYHLVCCHVETRDTAGEHNVLAQAMSCGAFLTPNTCYSTIVIAVVGTRVDMGLMTMLQPPQSPTDATDDEVDFQGIQAPLPPLPESLFQNTGISRLRCILKGLTWDVSFDYIDVARNNPFVLRRYLSILCKPIIYGMQRSYANRSVGFNWKGRKACHCLQYESVHPELLLSGSSRHFIVKRMTVREPDEVIEIHRKVGNPIRGSYVCDLSRKIQDVPAQEQSTEFIETTSSCSEEEIQIDKYDGYKQMCCVYDCVPGCRCNGYVLTDCGRAVLLCMVAAMHDDLHVAHCNISEFNMVIKSTKTADQHTLTFINWEYGVKLSADRKSTQTRPMHEVITKDFNRCIGSSSVKKLTWYRSHLNDRYDDKKSSYYRFLDIFCATCMSSCHVRQEEFSEMISLNKDKPSRDAVRWLVAKYASQYLFKRVAECIEQHRLVDMTYAQLAAFPFSYR